MKMGVEGLRDCVPSGALPHPGLAGPTVPTQAASGQCLMEWAGGRLGRRNSLAPSKSPYLSLTLGAGFVKVVPFRFEHAGQIFRFALGSPAGHAVRSSRRKRGG